MSGFHGDVMGTAKLVRCLKLKGRRKWRVKHTKCQGKVSGAGRRVCLSLHNGEEKKKELITFSF